MSNKKSRISWKQTKIAKCNQKGNESRSVWRTLTSNPIWVTLYTVNIVLLPNKSGKKIEELCPSIMSLLKLDNIRVKYLHDEGYLISEVIFNLQVAEQAFLLSSANSPYPQLLLLLRSQVDSNFLL